MVYVLYHNLSPFQKGKSQFVALGAGFIGWVPKIFGVQNLGQKLVNILPNIIGWFVHRGLLEISETVWSPGHPMADFEPKGMCHGQVTMEMTRAGQRTHSQNELERSTTFQWGNPLFLWPCSIASCMFTRCFDAFWSSIPQESQPLIHRVHQLSLFHSWLT